MVNSYLKIIFIILFINQYIEGSIIYKNYLVHNNNYITNNYEDSLNKNLYEIIKNKYDLLINNLNKIPSNNKIVYFENKIIDKYFSKKYEKIKNLEFKKNIIDTENNLIVKSVYFRKNNKNNSIIKLLWQYYKDRNKNNVNDIIKKYDRNNLIINYSITI
jgi:hypothetical protein